MQYTAIQRPHWLLSGATRAPKQLPPAARRFWRYCLAARAGILAEHEGEIVGFLRYNPEDDGTPMWALGTWVHPRWRNAGIARMLWGRALWEELPGVIHVGVVSKAGRRFAETLARTYTKIDWELEMVK